MNTNATTSQPLDLEAAFRAQRTAARNALPAMLALLPLAVVTAACSFVTRFLFALGRGRNALGEAIEAAEELEAADGNLPADVRAVADVILAAVVGHTAPDMVPARDEGDWELDALAEYLAVVQAVRREAILPRSVQGDTPDAPAPLAVRQIIITALPDRVSRVEVDGKVFVAHEGGA